MCVLNKLNNILKQSILQLRNMLFKRRHKKLLEQKAIDTQLNPQPIEENFQLDQIIEEE